jgi:hypothetical protein
MNFKKTFDYVVVFFSIVTIVLICALSVALFGVYRGLAYGLILTLFFGAIIAIGLWSQRVRKVIKSSSIPLDSLSKNEIIEIPLMESLNKYEFNAWPIVIALIVVLFILNFQFILNDLEYSMGNIFFWLNAIIISIFSLAIIFLRIDLNKKKDLFKLSPVRRVLFTHEGIHLPFEMITQSGVIFALKNKQPDIFIPWNEIQSWEVYPGGGQSPSQFSLSLTGDSKKYCSPLGLLGIVRTSEITPHEERILNFASQHLNCDIRIRS